MNAFQQQAYRGVPEEIKQMMGKHIVDPKAKKPFPKDPIKYY